MGPEKAVKNKATVGWGSEASFLSPSESKWWPNRMKKLYRGCTKITPNQNSLPVKATKWLFLLTRPTGFEPVTYGLEVT
ncbi:MAG: hypothetical protein ACWGOX_11535, partial [Desulforhopalus sp.]